MSAQNPFVSDKRWEDMSWAEYNSQPDMVTTMIERRELKARNLQLEGALRAIMTATVEGRVCNDVAWFDGITTLHDFCDLVLNGPDVEADGPAGRIAREAL